MRTAATVVILLVGTLSSVLVITFWLNGVPWHLPPGRFARLVTYLTTHVADTNEASPFPELRPRQYSGVSAAQLFTAVDESMAKLGWAVSQRDPTARVLRAVITTPLLKFQDDIEIAVVDGGRGGAGLRIRSVSRTGQGDLGANTGHVLTLYRTLDARLPPPAEALPLK